MAKGKGRKKAIAAKNTRKQQAMLHPSGKSRYGRKKQYCDKAGKFGFQVADPKPWKK